jgi:hypothetical protein
MTDNDTALAVLEACDRRRAERRRFLSFAASGTAAVGGLGLLSACGHNNSPTPTPTPTPTATPTPTGTTDADILNFALNLEYLEAQFYMYAVSGAGLRADYTVGGNGQAAGTVTGGRAVTFTDTLVRDYAREIAQDELQHVAFLRGQLASSAVAMPNINIAGGAGGAFATVATAAGLPGGSTFDPYASDENFLLGAFIFEDVGVTAYKGAAPLLANKTYVEAAAGILAAEAYHASLVRTVLYRKGIATPALQLIEATTKISDLRDTLDGAPANDDIRGVGADDDQGVASPDGGVTSNIVPTNVNGLAYSRTTGQVLNIVYGTKSAVAGGLFFPNGVNGNIKTSTAE